jgi:RecB family endonuclease NucS
MFVRTKYLPRNNKLKSINYVPPEKLTVKLIDEAKRLNFEIKLGKKTPWAYAEAKIMGVIDEVPFLIERVHDPATSNTHLYHYQTFAYIKTKKKDELSITQKDIRQDLNSINNSIKKTIITNLKSELNWALNENIFITKIDFSNGSMGAVLCNEYNLAPYLKQTLELLVKIVKIYEQA